MPKGFVYGSLVIHPHLNSSGAVLIEQTKLKIRNQPSSQYLQSLRTHCLMARFAEMEMVANLRNDKALNNHGFIV